MEMLLMEVQSEDPELLWSHSGYYSDRLLANLC